MILTASRSGHLFSERHGPPFCVVGIDHGGTREVLCTSISTRDRAEYIARSLVGFLSYASITAEPDTSDLCSRISGTNSPGRLEEV